MSDTLKYRGAFYRRAADPAANPPSGAADSEARRSWKIRLVNNQNYEHYFDFKDQLDNLAKAWQDQSQIIVSLSETNAEDVKADDVEKIYKISETLNRYLRDLEIYSSRIEQNAQLLLDVLEGRK